MTIKKPTKKISKKSTKTVKKHTVKKSVKKITISKAQNKKKARRKKKILIIASPDKCFWIQCGPVVKDIFELRDALLNVSGEQFNHHVNSTKNDFAVWVDEVLNDKDCARNIKKTKTLNTTIKVLENTLKYY